MRLHQKNLIKGVKNKKSENEEISDEEWYVCTCYEHTQRPKHDMKPNSGKTKISQRRQKNRTDPTGKKLSARGITRREMTAQGSDNRKLDCIE